MTRTLEELLAEDDPAWPLVQTWVKEARVPVKLLPADEVGRGQALVATQVTVCSPMGAVIYNTGGMLIDQGWLRLLGSGHTKLARSLPSWNQGRSVSADGKSLGFLLIADDVVGGFFALNGAALGPGSGQVLYCTPDTLRWEPMNGLGYSQFVVWSLSLNMKQFYQGMYWDGWESEVSSRQGDQAFSIYPPLCTVEGKNIAACSRRPASVAEIFSLNVLELPKQLQSHSERS